MYVHDFTHYEVMRNIGSTELHLISSSNFKIIVIVLPMFYLFL